MYEICAETFILYKYGWTGIPEHLPNGSSINKQITYGEYLEKYKGMVLSSKPIRDFIKKS